MAHDPMQVTISTVIRETRNDALDAAIEICREYAKTGHNAECCVRALENLKASLPRPPSEAN